MTLWVVVTAVCIGTFLVRYLPLHYGARIGRSRGLLGRFLGSLGIAAVTALLVLSMDDLWRQSPDLIGALQLLLGTGAGWVIQRVTRNIGLATVGSALAYGVTGQLSAFF